MSHITRHSQVYGIAPKCPRCQDDMEAQCKRLGVIYWHCYDCGIQLQEREE